MQQQQETSDVRTIVRNVSGLGVLAIFIWALPLELILRRNFGRRYIDWMLLPAALWPTIFAVMFAAEADPTWGGAACWLTIILGAIHKMLAYWFDFKTMPRHSQYDGTPYCSDLLRMEERACKRYGEPAVAFVLGIVLTPVSESLGMFVIAGAMAIAIKNLFFGYWHEERVTDVRDAYLEQRALADRFGQGAQFHC